MLAKPSHSRQGAGAEAASLRREAEILAHARHPGVVEMVTVTTHDGATELVTACPAGRLLDELALSVEEIAGVVAALATTVADLHDIGVAHLRLVPDAVTVADDGRVVLGGFADAIRLAGSPSSWPRQAAARIDDAALGRLLGDLLDRCAPATVVDAWEARQWAWVGIRRRRRGGPTADMRQWAAYAAAGAVPSRRLADALATGVPTARLPIARRPSPPPPTGTTTPPASGRAVDPDGKASIGSSIGSPTDDGPCGEAQRWVRGREPDNPRGDGVAPAAEGHDGDEAIDRWLAPLNADPPPVDRGARVGPSSVGPPPRSRRPRLFVAPVAAAAVAVLAGALKDGHRRASLLTGGAGCIAGTNARSCATYHDGILIAAGERFAVGQVGDVPAVGRWNCRDATLALLRPPTGEVWVFERWPVDDEGVAAKPAGRVPNAIRLIVRASDHCDTLLAVRPDGTTPVLTGLRP